MCQLAAFNLTLSLRALGLGAALVPSETQYDVACNPALSFNWTLTLILTPGAGPCSSRLGPNATRKFSHP